MAFGVMSSKLSSCRFSKFMIRFNSISRCMSFSRSKSTIAIDTNEDEYSETPEYPPLFDPSRTGRGRMRRQEEYDRIQALPTVEEKLVTFYTDSEGRRKKAYHLAIINEFDLHYNTLPFKLYATRTSLKEGQLPEVYNTMNVDALAEYIKPIVMNAILDTFEGIEKHSKFKHVKTPTKVLVSEDKLRGRMMTDTIFRTVTSLLSSQLPHLRDCQVDDRARCEAYWLSAGFAPSQYFKNIRMRTKVVPRDAPMDTKCQYIGRPYIQLRHTQPLPPFVDRDDALCTTYDVPECSYQSIYSGLQHKENCPVNLPGFWPGDPYGFGSLSVFTTHEVRQLIAKFGEDCCRDALHGCGVVSSFGFLVALANLKGFTPYNEITYPLTTQTILTNGKHWSFYAYQLNAMCLQADFYSNQCQNICWTTNDMKLFETIENGKIVGYNDEVVKLFLKFMVHAPKEREGVNLTPYLQSVEHVDGDEKWAATCYRFKRFCANQGFDIPYGKRLWETIYKVKFNTRLE